MASKGCVICGKEGRLARGLCPKHYMRWWKHGDPNYVKQEQMHGYSLAERFWAKVDKEGPVPEIRPELGPCWIWTAFRQPKTGYGVIRVDRRSCLAHRIAYELDYGPIPEGLEIDHLCNNRVCVRPDHLEAVTREENMRRAPGWLKYATHCPKGHLYDEENTYYSKDGSRSCRACRNERNRMSYWRKKGVRDG